MRRIAWIVVPIVLIGLLGLAVFAVRAPGATTAFTLQPGDCFDIPGDAQVGDIATLDCGKPHDAEVFVARAVYSPSPTGFVPYPGDTGFGEFVGANCGAAAEQAYLGAGATTRPDLVVGYFFPTADAWSRGELRVTCYLHASAGSKLSAPLRGPEPSAAAS